MSLYPVQQLKQQMRRYTASPAFKGELWLGTELFKTSGLSDTVESHIALAGQLDQAMVCLPVSDGGTKKPDLGYRYFTVSDIKKGIDSGARPIFAVIDGPFQEMVNTMGLMEVLTGWATEREEIVETYTAEMEKRLTLVSQVLACPPAAIVITDDMAFDNGPLISPQEMETLCTPFYEQAVSRIHACGIPVLLHSCGNISKLVPTFKAWSIDGFAAIQSGLNDLAEIYGEFDNHAIFMAGIENDLLDTAPLPDTAQKKLDDLISLFGANEDLILCSSCGLYKGEYLEQIKKIYNLAATTRMK